MKETIITITIEENRWIYKVVGAHGTVLMGRQRFKPAHDGYAVALIAALDAVPYPVFCRAMFGQQYSGKKLPVSVNTDSLAFVERLRNLVRVEEAEYPYSVIKGLMGRFEIDVRCIPVYNLEIQRMKRWYTDEERALFDISQQIETSLSQSAKLA